MVSVTDTHVHVVSSDTDRYPLRPRDFGRDWWTGRPVDAAQIVRDLDAAGVDRAVIVQAVGPYGNDNRYALEVVGEHVGRFAAVVAIDTNGGDPASELAMLVDSGGVAGVRVAAFAGEAPWITDGRGAAIWDAAAECGTNLVVACLAPHVPAVAELARSRPDVIVAMDHCAFPDLEGGPPYRRAAPLLELAALPSVHLKLSTIVLRDAERTGSAPALVALLVERFGAHRICWGSDHPQTYELPYDQMVQLALRATDGLDADARAAVLDTTARRLWFAGR
jgi:predicted TIM-barrel fold metal-dependent hydrolase